jgi:predicted AAA+ superfamily ATPase
MEYNKFTIKTMLFKRIFKISSKSKHSFFLFGPRGTGKTTWLKQNFLTDNYIDLLEPKTFRILLGTPERLSDFIINQKKWIIIDEVQKAPELLNEVHRLIESKKYKFILTGSSARSLRRKGVNLLAGRALTYHFYPLTVQELGTKFSLKHSLQYGQLPLAYTSDEPEKYLQTYLQTYLKEEIQQEGLTRNIGNFARFMEIASFSQGEILSITDIARESQLERKTVEGYFEILEDLLMATQIPVFSKRAKRKLIKKRKFYYFDVGIFRALRPAMALDSESEIDGPALETLFLQELRAINDYQNLNYQIFYWRTKTGLEVDFILYGPKKILAIEIKRKGTLLPKDLKGLKAFGEDYPEAEKIIFCNVKKEERRDDIRIIPIKTALQNLEKIMKK